MRNLAPSFIAISLAAVLGLASLPVHADHGGRVRLCDPGEFWNPDGPESETGSCVTTCPFGSGGVPVHCLLGPSEPPPASVLGVKFQDLDADGVKDSGEQGLPGWEIELFCDPVLQTALTDGAGQASFTDLEAPASCSVSEVQQPGWVATTAETVEVQLEPGQTRVVYFGNVTFEGLIENLINQVEGLVSDGILDAGPGSGLIAKLEAARSEIEAGNDLDACGPLGAFINQVEALLRTTRLDPGEGQALIDAARVIRDSLGC